MDLSPLYHGLMAIAVQIVYGIVTGDFITGGVLASGFFIGREHAQAEERIIKSHYDGKRSNMPALGGLKIKAWNVPSFLDLVVPILMVVLVYFLVVEHFDFLKSLL